MKINKILSSVILFFFLGSSALAANLNSTKYLLRGEIAPFSGYLVDQKRIEKSIRIAQELDYQKKLNEIQEKYYEEKLRNQELTKELEIEKERRQAAAVEKGLKEELSKKNVWYRAPWFVATSTAIILILTRGLAP